MYILKLLPQLQKDLDEADAEIDPDRKVLVSSVGLLEFYVLLRTLLFNHRSYINLHS